MVTYEYAKPTHLNTTYTVDLCAGLKAEGGKEEERCPDGTRGESLLLLVCLGWVGWLVGDLCKGRSYPNGYVFVLIQFAP